MVEGGVMKTAMLMCILISVLCVIMFGVLGFKHYELIALGGYGALVAVIFHLLDKPVEEDNGK